MADLRDNIQWPVPPASFPLGAKDVHVWAANLCPASTQAALYESSLSPDELTRASRFLFQRDRIRFVAGRGILRYLLAHYLGQLPAHIQIVYGHHGKPALANMPSGGPLHFNLAHSDDLAVFAISRISGIGIDVERLRPLNDAESIAERFFSARETKVLKTLPSSQKETGFFNLWTRKEAWLKATGEGIGELLSQVEVSLKPGEPARLLSLFDDPHAASKWTLREIVPAPGYLGALAAPTNDLTVHCWQWPKENILTVSLPPRFTGANRINYEHI